MSRANEGPQATTEFALEAFLPYRLSLLSNTVSQGIAAIYQADHDLSVTEWRVLAVLGRFPGLTASEVVARTAMDKVAIHRAVKRLAERDLLRRQRHPGDRRALHLHLTARGQLWFGEIVPRVQAWESALLESLTTDEGVLLDRLLQRLQEAAALLAPPSPGGAISD